MSSDPPFEEAAEEPDDAEDPFSALAGFGALGGSASMERLMGMLQSVWSEPGSPGRTQARDVARAAATEGSPEPNIDPSERIAVEQLARVAELHISEVTGLAPGGGTALKLEAVNRLQWSDRTIEDYASLFESIGKALSSGFAPDDEDQARDPMSALLARVTGAIGPAMLNLAVGAMVGRLARQALGGYTLPVPRRPATPMLVNLPNVDEFGRAWSLEPEGLRLWVCLHEAAYHAVFGVEHVSAALRDLLERHAAGFDAAAKRLEQHFGGLESLSEGPEALARLQESLGDPDAVLGAARSPAQQAVLPQLNALVAALSGYVDHTMDTVGVRLISDYDRLSEALRRKRLEAGASDKFIGRLLGLELDAALYDRGSAFIAGVVERAGEPGLSRLFSDPVNLPTPAEVDAAGLWLARIDITR